MFLRTINTIQNQIWSKNATKKKLSDLNQYAMTHTLRFYNLNTKTKTHDVPISSELKPFIHLFSNLVVCKF